MSSVFPGVKREPPVLQLLFLASGVLSLGTTENTLAPSSLFTHFRYLYILIRSFWAFSSPSGTMSGLSTFPSQERCSSPSIILEALWWTLKYIHEEPRTGYSAPGVASSATNDIFKKRLQLRNILGVYLKKCNYIYISGWLQSEGENWFSRSVQVKCYMEEDWPF